MMALKLKWLLPTCSRAKSGTIVQEIRGAADEIAAARRIIFAPEISGP
jgi:hypothetical protein